MTHSGGKYIYSSTGHIVHNVLYFHIIVLSLVFQHNSEEDIVLIVLYLLDYKSFAALVTKNVTDSDFTNHISSL